MKLIMFESICVKVRIYCIFIPKVENKMLKNNPPKKCTCLFALLMKPGVSYGSCGVYASPGAHEEFVDDVCPCERIGALWCAMCTIVSTTRY